MMSAHAKAGLRSYRSIEVNLIFLEVCKIQKMMKTLVRYIFDNEHL